MSSREVRKVSREDIQLVQNLIERCIQLYMNQEEVIRTLLRQAKIEPHFTELVWQKLEEENPDFFRGYYLRLIVKDQIQRFNELLKRQADSMHMYATASIPMSNGSQIRPVPQNSTYEATDNPAQNMHRSVNGNSHHVQINGASSVQSCVQAAIDVSAHGRRIDVSPNIQLSESSNGRGMMRTVGYSGDSRLLYGSEGNVFGDRPGMGDTSASPFSNVESNAQPLNENVLAAGNSSVGFLGQIPRNFSLSDLTADFSNSSDILGSYSGSAFLGTDTDNILEGRGDRQGWNDK